jgi:ethanolamine utilization protein EutL
MAYLIAPPLEAVTGLDAALKAADVTLNVFYGPPTETNFAGGLLTGDQAACQAACEAFSETVCQIADMPLEKIE